MEINYHYATEGFDNFLVQYQRGNLRQINDYYPYGLSIHGINANNDEYLNKYTSKELQMLEMCRAGTNGYSSSSRNLLYFFSSGKLEMCRAGTNGYSSSSRHLYYSFSGGTGEFDPSLSTGLEMFDFHARFYDPQLGRWFAPDPAMQYSNPYLGIGNNPVMYVDPDGEFAILPILLVAKKIAVAAKATAKVAKTVAAVAKVGAKKVATFSKSKAFKAGVRGGTINTLSNYDYKEGWGDFGWGTFGDFAAGFG